MKNKIIGFVLILVSLLVLVSCQTTSNKCKVTFVVDDKEYASYFIDKGEKAYKVENPTIDGMEFMYWMLNNKKYDFSKEVNEDITLVAKFEEISNEKHIILYFVDFMPVSVEYVNHNKKIETKTWNVTGYEFVYWYTEDGEKFDTNTSVTEDLVLFAAYRTIGSNHNFFKVTYIQDDEPLVLLVEEGGYAKNPLEDSIWLCDDDIYDFTTPVTKDLVLVYDDQNTRPYPDPDTPVTITYWHANGQALINVLEEIKDSFEEYYNGKYKVELISYGDYTTLRDTILASISYGSHPTTAQAYPDHIALYNRVDALRPLDFYIEDPIYGMSIEEQNQFIEGFWNEGTIYDNAHTRYALPFNKSTEIMYYNKTLFDKYGWSIPKTWDDVNDIATKWKKTSEYASILQTYPGQVYALGIDSEANAFITLSQQWGATYTSFNESGKGIFNAFGENNSDTLKSKEAMNWLVSSFKNGNIATSTAFGTNYCSDAFKNGQCIMVLGSSAGSNYHDGQTAYSKFETGVSSVPQKDLNNGQVIQQGTNVVLFKSGNIEEEFGGWLWLKYLTSYESSLKWALETSYFPIRKDVLNSKEYQNHILGNVVLGDGSVIEGVQTLAAKVKQVGLAQQNWFFVNAAFPGSAQARDEATIIIQQILYGNKSIDNAYNEALNSLRY